MSCYYFGCWGQPGHYLFEPGGHPSRAHSLEYYGPEQRHIDGTLAPRRMLRTGEICWEGMSDKGIKHVSDELPQGQFLLHLLDTGYTAIQWWDRCQGDRRGACNSTILLEGRHTAEEMLVALRDYFPRVIENLVRAGIELVEVKI